MSDRELLYSQNLNPEQIAACKCMDNMLLTACPGSGKTRTLSYKLAYLADFFSESRKLHIAITYTNRAANEILSRIEDMGIDADNIWAGTIHQFCMEFIIRPYAMYSDRLRRGYHIIDEYVQHEYKKALSRELGIKCNNWELDKHPQIIKAYKKRLIERREIDFDDILTNALDILSAHPYISENISSIIASIQVDEYQDTNERQYQILSKICEKNDGIIISFIGDVNQAIYGDLGGIAKTKDEICSLFHMDFKELHLTGCYRSIQKIIDYYSHYAVNKTNIISMREDSDSDGIISLTKEVDKDDLADYIATIVKESLSMGIFDKDICIVAPQWELIFLMANKLRMKLPNVRFDAPDITPFKYDPMNPFYLLARLSFTRPQSHEKIRRRYANEIIAIIKNDYSINIREGYDCYNLLEAINSVLKASDSDGIEIYRDIVGKVMSSMGINIKNEEVLNNCYKQFLEKTEERIKNNGISKSCGDFLKSFEEKNGVVINTIHGVKGEEYQTVIAFGLLDGYVPHWDTIINDSAHRTEKTNRLLYVLGSRSKENLYLISETGRKTSKGNPYMITEEIANIKWMYD